MLPKLYISAQSLNVMKLPTFAALALSLCLNESVTAADAVKLTRIYEKIETKWPIAVVIPPDGS